MTCNCKGKVNRANIKNKDRHYRELSKSFKSGSKIEKLEEVYKIALNVL